MTSNPKRMAGSIVFIAVLAIASAVGAAAGKELEVAYPEGYRQWSFLYSSMMPVATFNTMSKKPCEKPCLSGLHHFYANEKAMEGLRTGSYPDGAVFVDEIVEWLSTPGGGAKEGDLVGIAVMSRDSQHHSSTGGWGWGVFNEVSKTDKASDKTRESCLKCHVTRKDHSYVFSEHQER